MNPAAIFSRLAVPATVLLLTVLAAEAVLRLGIDVLPKNFQNILLSRYNRRPDGIYYRHDAWNINVLKPDRHMEIYYNALHWRHQTNDISIRSDRPVRQADIIALGDSFIYGHGVDIEDTLCRNLEKISQKSVANLGVQGDYPVSQFIRLKQLGLYLRPKLVLFFINREQDCSDFLIYRPNPADADAILSGPMPDYQRSIHASEYLKGYANRHVRITDRLSQYFYTARLTLGVARSLWGAFRPQSGETGQWDLEKIRNMTQSILAGARDLCKKNGAQLLVVFHANAPADIHRLKNFLAPRIADPDPDTTFKRICRDLGIPFLDLGRLSPQKAYFIDNDFHYSPGGNRWAARCIYNHITAKGMLTGGPPHES